MSVKKLLLLTAAGIASVGATAFAGGPDQMPAPVFQPNIYVEGNLGYVRSNWSLTPVAVNPFANNAGTVVTTGGNGTGGFTFGFALGYNFIKHFSGELGWDWIPQANGTGRILPVANNGLNVSSWVIYLAGKLDVPVMDNVDLFGKLGAAYRSLSWGGAGATGVALNPSGNTGYWSPMFGAGLQYSWNDNFYILAQWKHIMSNINNASVSQRAPQADFFTLGLGYRFAV